MTLVRLTRSWVHPDPLRQTPGGAGEWGGTRFTFDPVDECDYVVALNRPPRPLSVRCPPGNAWQVVLEPPIGFHRGLQRGDNVYARVYTQDPELPGPRYRHTHPPVPWQVERSYDELRAVDAPPAKSGDLSWVTSNAAALPGHRARLRFLARLERRVDLALFGRGFHPLADKWDGLAPYRYSLAVENFRGGRYWTEKLADCFLAWTMPIYCGSPAAVRDFPAGSVATVDIDDPAAPERVREIVASDRYEHGLEAIAEARRLVLERYQLFPFLAAELERHRAEAPTGAPRRLELPGGERVPPLLRLTPLGYPRPRRTLVAAHARAYRAWLRVSERP